MGHHLQRHYLTPEQAAGALAVFNTADSKVAARHIARMSQADLRQAFTAVYGTETHSNNNAWLRRKLLDAVGASRRLCNRTQAKPRRRAAAPAAPPAASRQARSSHSNNSSARTSPAPGSPCYRTPRAQRAPRSLAEAGADLSSGSSNSLTGVISLGAAAARSPAAPSPASIFADGLLVNTHTMESSLQEEDSLPPYESCLTHPASAAPALPCAAIPGTPSAGTNATPDPMRLLRTPSDLSNWEVTTEDNSPEAVAAAAGAPAAAAAVGPVACYHPTAGADDVAAAVPLSQQDPRLTLGMLGSLPALLQQEQQAQAQALGALLGLPQQPPQLLHQQPPLPLFVPPQAKQAPACQPAAAEPVWEEWLA